MIATYLVLFLMLLVVGLFLIWSVFGVIADILGAPFVPSSQKKFKEAFSFLKIKPGTKVYDLGSGNGKVLRSLSRWYKIEGVGIELNPVLCWYSLLLNKLWRVKKITFKQGNFFKESFAQADIIYVFLLSRTLQKLEKKILKECKKGTVVVSHGFKIPGFKNYLIKTFDGKGFSTYIYKLR